MDLYERIRKEDLSKLSAEEFTALLNEYENDFSRLGLPVNEQIEIRNALDEEAKARKYRNADFRNASYDIKELESKLGEIERLKETVPPEFLKETAVDARVSSLKDEIERKKAMIEEMEAEKKASKLSSTMKKKIRLSILNKRVENGKKAIASIPQRICTLSKRKLNRMYNRVRDAYHNVNDTLDERSLSVEDALNGLFEKRDDILATPGITPAQNYIIESQIKSVADKYVSRYRKIERKKHVLATLKSGTVRVMNLSRALADKLMKTQGEEELIQENSFSM